MANTAYTTCIVTGDRTQIDRLQAVFDRLEQTPVSSDVEDNGWDSYWLGCLAKDLGGKNDEIYSRGSWTQAYFNDAFGYMVIEIETAWRVPEGIIQLIEQTFPGIKIWYYTMLEGYTFYATNDDEGKYFGDQVGYMLKGIERAVSRTRK